MEVQNRFGELLAKKERLEGRSISRRQVAEETGISLSSVQKWATNSLARFDATHIIAFCDYFSCSVGELLIVEEGSEEGQQETLLATA